jgi:hypothetical protein
MSPSDTALDSAVMSAPGRQATPRYIPKDESSAAPLLRTSDVATFLPVTPDDGNASFFRNSALAQTLHNTVDSGYSNVMFVVTHRFEKRFG